MISPEELSSIFDRIVEGKQTEADITVLRQVLGSLLGSGSSLEGDQQQHQAVLQLSKYNINIAEGKGIHIGDRIYVELNDEAMEAIIQTIKKASSMPIGIKISLVVVILILIVLSLLFYASDLNNYIPVDKIIPLKVAIEEMTTEETTNLLSSLKLFDIVVSKKDKSLIFDLRAMNRSDGTVFIHGLDFYRISASKESSRGWSAGINEIPSVIYKGGRSWEEVDEKLIKSFSTSQVIPPRSIDRFQVELEDGHYIKNDLKEDWFVNVLYDSLDNLNKSLIYRIHFMVLGSHLY